MIKKTIRFIKKKIIKSFFLIINGKIKLNSHKKVKLFETHNIKFKNGKNCNLFEIENCRIFYNKIADVAYIKDNFFLKEPSTQISEYIHRPSKTNYVFQNGTPKFKKNLNKTIFSTLYTTASSFNYYHWIIEVLPKLAILESSHLKKKVDYYLFPSLKKRFQNESLDLLNIPKKKRLSADKFSHIQAKKILSCEHPYIRKNQLKEDTNYPGWLIYWLKKKFLRKIKKKKSINIFIDRGDSLIQNRKILNEGEIKKYLLKKNFKFIKLSNYSFKKQIELFFNAKCVVGLHGAGFVNIIFCKKGTKIVELSTVNKLNPFESLAKKNNLKYFKIFPNEKSIGQRSQDVTGKFSLKLLQKII